jgi:pre-rRNA-processing protein TSR3
LWYVFTVTLLILGHTEWGEKILEGFSWGHAFFEVNGDLLAKYAKCTDAEDVGRVQEAWLKQLEQEWTDSRDTGDKSDEDEWAGGNPNHIPVDDDDDEEEDTEEEGENEVNEEGGKST